MMENSPRPVTCALINVPEFQTADGRPSADDVLVSGLPVGIVRFQREARIKTEVILFVTILL